MKGTGKDSSHRGFTLIELVVTIAILAVLMSLLVPALSKAKALGRVAKCQSNLRQLGIGLRLYVDDQEQYPSTTRHLWFDLLKPYTGGGPTILPEAALQNDDVFLCPGGKMNIPIAVAVQIDQRTTVYTNKLVPTLPPYGYNAFATKTIVANKAFGPESLGLGEGCLESSVKNPSDMIAIGCAKAAYTCRYLGPYIPDLYPVGDWHSGRANMVFCDGHAELNRVKLWSAKTDSARKRWNNDNEPHRETWAD